MLAPLHLYRSGVICLFCLILLAFPRPSLAATKTWTGNTSGNWNSTGNWLGGVVPVNGDDLVFPANPTRLTITNNLAGLNLQSLTFSGSNYLVRGNSLSLTNGISASYFAAPSTLDLPLQLQAPQTFNCTNPGSFLVISGDLNNNNNLLTLDGSGIITFASTCSLTGAGGLTRNGAGVCFVEGSNAFTGVVTINSGVVSVTHSFGLGATNGATVVQGTGSLILETGVHVGSKPLSLNAPADNPNAALATQNAGGSSNSWDGSITLLTNVAISVASGTTLNLAGSVVGQGGFTKSGTGTLILSGAPANNYFGDTTVNAGILQLSKPGGEAIHENSLLTIGDGVGGAGSDVVRYTAANQINSGVTILLNSSGLLDLNGFSDTIGPLNFNGGKVTTGSGTLTMVSGLSVNDTETNTSTMSGLVALGAGTHTFNILDNTAGIGLVIDANIGGTGALAKTGPGTMTLQGSNSYSGLTSISAGTLRVESDLALGSTNTGTTVNSGGQLVVGGLAGNLFEPLTLNGFGPTNGGALTVEGGVDWNTGIVLGSDAAIGATSTSIVRVHGSVSGSANLTKVGAGTLNFNGAAANTYSGTTFINEGAIELEKNSLNVSIIGPIVVGTGSGVPGSKALRLNLPTQIDNNADMLINADGIFEMNNNQDAIGSLTGSGQVHIGFAFLNVGVNNASTIFSGVISGISGDLSKLGTGTLTLSGSNTYSGTTTVSAGTLIVNGFQPQSPVSLLTGTKLGGSGTVGAISVSGSGFSIAPGSSLGILTCSNFTGGSGTLQIELNGSSPGTGYDQLNVRGTVALNGLTLDPTLNFGGAISNQYTIIKNDGADAIGGMFSGLPEGSTLNIGGNQFLLTYAGGDGNDVVLTQLSLLPSLAIERASSSAVRLLWPTNAQAFNLENNTNLAGTNWLSTSPSPTIIGTNNVVTNSTSSASAKFYRLRKP